MTSRLIPQALAILVGLALIAGCTPALSLELQGPGPAQAWSAPHVRGQGPVNGGQAR